MGSGGNHTESRGDRLGVASVAHAGGDGSGHWREAPKGRSQAAVQPWYVAQTGRDAELPVLVPPLRRAGGTSRTAALRVGPPGHEA